LVQLTDNFDDKRIPVKEADRNTGPYPYYGASGIVDYVDSYIFDGEYLLIAEDGENLRTRNTPIAFLATGKYWVNNHAHVVKGNSRADTRYLMYALRHVDYSGFLSGSTMPKLTQGNLNRIPIPTPPLLEQRRIATVLGSLDDKIEHNNRMNETLEAMAQALFKSWFVDFNPVKAKAAGKITGLPKEIDRLFPSSFQVSELGKIPKDWNVGIIGDLADVVGGSTPSTKESTYWVNGTNNWVTPKDLSALKYPVLLSTERCITDAGLATIGSGLLPKGTVLMSSRAPIGYLAIAEIPVAINQGFIAMKPKEGMSNLHLLSWARHSQELIISRANGSTFLEISKSSFRPLPIVIPPQQVIDAFDVQARSLHNRIVMNEKESKSLTEVRDTLLPKLVSGKITG